jgi:hypothetical protein
MGENPREGKEGEWWDKLAAATTQLGRNWKLCQDMGNIPQSYPNIIFIRGIMTGTSPIDDSFLRRGE